MGLTNFFRINMPYGMRQLAAGKWHCFNREYAPIGWNDNTRDSDLKELISSLPIETAYKGLTEDHILQIVKDAKAIHKDSEGNITEVFFYDDSINPQVNQENWDRYTKILSELTKFEVDFRK